MATSYKEGDLLFTSQPFVHVLSLKELDTRCDQCFNNPEELKKCASCKQVKYCNRGCQKSAWVIHKHECACLKHVAPILPTDSVRLIYKILVKLQYTKGSSSNEQVFSQVYEFNSLLSHSDDIKKDMDRCEDLVKLSQLLNIYSCHTIKMPTSTEFMEIFGRMVVNSHSIYDQEMRPIGVGLYLGVSKLNHSCRPNAVVVFSGITAHVRCMEAFTNEVGEALISYVDVLQTTEQRKEDLQLQYFFTCHCGVCQDGVNDALMSATRCTGAGCDGAVVQTMSGLTCNACNLSPDESYKEMREFTQCDAAKLMTAIKDLVESSEDNSTVVIRRCELGLKEHNLLHSSNVNRLQLEEMAFDECIKTSQWDKALCYGRIVLVGYTKYLQQNHPLQGVHRMKLGKILLFQGEFSDAVKMLSEAEPVLEVTHGVQHSLYLLLRELLYQAKAEMSAVEESN